MISDMVPGLVRRDRQGEGRKGGGGRTDTTDGWLWACNCGRRASSQMWAPCVPDPMSGWGTPQEPVTAGELLQVLQDPDIDPSQPVEIVLLLHHKGDEDLTGHTFIAADVGVSQEDGTVVIDFGDDGR